MPAIRIHFLLRMGLYLFVALTQVLEVFSIVFSSDGGKSLTFGLGVDSIPFVLLEIVELALLVAVQLAVEKQLRKTRLSSELSAEVNRAILLNEDETKILGLILDYGLKILNNARVGSVLAFNESGELVMVAWQGFTQQYVESFHIRLEETFQFVQTGGHISQTMIIRPEIIKQFESRLAQGKRRTKSIISAPLFVEDKLYGLLTVDSDRAVFGAVDIDVLNRFRSQIEVCLLARERYRTSLAKSRVDTLTGFLSRSFFDELAKHSIEHAKRYETTFTLGMFDVDGLKITNDRLGHLAGDWLLKTVAQSISGIVRKSDVLGRFGGDEFVAICYSTTAETMMAKTRQALADLKASEGLFEGEKVSASFSFGFADYPQDGLDLKTLIAAADARLYGVKSSRKR